MGIFLFALGFFIITLAFMSIKIIPHQSAWVIERLGKYHATLESGLNVVIPFVDRIAYRHRLVEFPSDIPPQICITKDNTQVTVDGVLYYQVNDAMAASYGASNYQQAITALAQTTLRSECGKRDLDKLLSERSEINTAVVSALDEAGKTWGVKVLRYEIKDITPPREVLAAMQMQITAEREKRAKIAESEGERQAAINKAEGEATAIIKQSEGDKQAAINKAEGEAKAIERTAQATSIAITDVAKAIGGDHGLEAVNLRVAQQYIDAFANLAKTNNTMILPGDVANVGAMIAAATQVIKKT